MSRDHVHAWVTDAGLVACEDQGSKNGCFYNGRAVTACYLEPSAVLRCAGTLMVLTVGVVDDNGAAGRTGLLGQSGPIAQVRRALEAAAAGHSPVLLLGETGTGKDVAASAVHRLSGRTGPMQTVNCATIPESLVASTLFGHRKGAFTGAAEARDGLIASADGGTLFLDEVDELPAVAQAALLRVLEDGMVSRVGETRPRRVDVRVVAATAREVDALEARGAFRRDLLARLDDHRLVLPPLRERREDILMLFDVFRGREEDVPIAALDTDTAEALSIAPWRYNVRGLRKLAVRLAGLHAPGAAPALSMLPEAMAAPIYDRDRLEAAAIARVVVPPPSPARLIEALRGEGGNLTRVASALGKDRKQVYRWLRRHGIDPDDYREDG